MHSKTLTDGLAIISLLTWLASNYPGDLPPHEIISWISYYPVLPNI